MPKRTLEVAVLLLALESCGPSADVTLASAPAVPTASSATVAASSPHPSSAARSTATLSSATVAPTSPSTASPSPATQRSTADRSGASAAIHYFYVLPADGVDEQLDTNGAIARSVASVQTWLAQQTGGRQLVVDTYGGQPDVTFFRLSQSDADILGSGPYVRDRIEQAMRAAGLIKPGKLYAVVYGGGSTYACGGGAWPPSLPGVVAAIYLKGTPPGAIPCAANVLGASAATPGYFDFSLLHELLHTMGLVASCAPHFTAAGHVSTDPRDLMYAGPQPWRPALLDPSHTDYYGHSVPGCPDLAKLGWLSG